MTVQHFLTLKDLPAAELQKIIQRAIELKQNHKAGKIHEPLKHKVMGMLFEKSSTRTRVSFETAMIQLGGHAIFLLPGDTQLGRGEPIEDMAKVLSRMVDVIMVRTYEHSKIETFAAHSSVPVINGLTDLAHPCQLLADVQTYIEHRGSIQGKTITWIGDGNNMLYSYINAAQQFDFKLNIASPEGYKIDAKFIESSHGHAQSFDDPFDAAKDSDMVVTDVWASMGQEQESHMRAIAFAPFQVTAAMMAETKNDALFMHCLPAHRGEEVTADVIDGPQSVVWDEAENRLHAQKALLEYLIAT